MRILIHEHFCGGGLAGRPLDSGLLAKGRGMLCGLVEDFHAAGQDVTVVLDERVHLRLPGRIVSFTATAPDRALDAFDHALSGVDAALVVAPETDDCLPGLIGRLERAGRVNLGSSSEAVRDAGDKYALACRLAAGRIAVPASASGLGQARAMLERHGDLVVKPNHGAGCVDTFVCRSVADLERLPARGDWLVQRRARGTAASVAFIVPRHGPPIPLRAGRQNVVPEDGVGAGRLAYAGGELPLSDGLESRAISLGLAALRHLSGLHGYVGIDVVLGETPADDVVIEVNARPTVAYAGLRRLARFNIADVMLGRPTEIAWHRGIVRYRADGTCEASLDGA